MSVIQKNFYSNSDVSIIDLMNTADSTFKGHHVVSLTNYDNTSLPAIAIGSVVENNGSLFEFTTETAISGSPSDGTVYILLIPSGDPALGTATLTPTFSNTSPTWSDSKQGFYGTSGSANYRYLEFKMTKATALYSNKRTFTHDDNIELDIANITTLSATTLTLPQSGINAIANFHSGASVSSYSKTDLFTALSPYIPNNGDSMLLVGITIYTTLRFHHRATRVSSTRITLFGASTTALDSITLDTPDATTGIVALSW